MNRKRVEYVKENAPMEIVVELLGGEIERGGKWTQIHCPLHPDETASAGISPDGMRFNCLACGVHGDVITLVRLARKVGFMEALKWLEDVVIRQVDTTYNW